MGPLESTNSPFLVTVTTLTGPEGTQGLSSWPFTSTSVRVGSEPANQMGRPRVCFLWGMGIRIWVLPGGNATTLSSNSRLLTRRPTGLLVRHGYVPGLLVTVQLLQYSLVRPITPLGPNKELVRSNQPPTISVSVRHHSLIRTLLSQRGLTSSNQLFLKTILPPALPLHCLGQDPCNY